MKLAMFTEPKGYVEWLTREIELLRAHGLKLANESLTDALAGIGKEAWCKMNNINPKNWDYEWERQIEYYRGRVRYLNRRINKYQKEIDKTRLEYGL